MRAFPKSDLGAPPSAAERKCARDRRRRDRRAGRHRRDPRRGSGRRRDPEACATDSLDAFGSCRLCLCEIEDARASRRRAPRPCRGHEGAHADRGARSPAARRRWSSTSPTTRSTATPARERPLRAAGHGRAGRLHAKNRYGDSRKTTLDEQGPSNPYFRSTPPVHRVLALRARLRGDPGHVRAHHPGTRLRVQGGGEPGPSFLESECVSCGACVQACPTGALMEKSVAELGQPARTRDHDVRLLRRRLLVPRRAEAARQSCA
jgi:formate dehydrogenase major subunit